MRRDVEVENAAAVVFDHKEAIKHAKPQCGNGKEVKCRHHLPMVVEEGQPALRLASIVVTLQLTEISRYGGLGNLEPQLEQSARVTVATE